VVIEVAARMDLGGAWWLRMHKKEGVSGGGSRMRWERGRRRVKWGYQSVEVHQAKNEMC